MIWVSNDSESQELLENESFGHIFIINRGVKENTQAGRVHTYAEIFQFRVKVIRKLKSFRSDTALALYNINTYLCIII